MRLPTIHEEQLRNINYVEYTPPVQDDPESGTMAAHAVQLSTPYGKNCVIEVPGSIAVPCPWSIDIPALQAFTFILARGEVVIALTLHNTPRSLPQG